MRESECVCERERERECVCVCVCVREREGVRVKERETSVGEEASTLQHSGGAGLLQPGTADFGSRRFGHSFRRNLRYDVPRGHRFS